MNTVPSSAGGKFRVLGRGLPDELGQGERAAGTLASSAHAPGRRIRRDLHSIRRAPQEVDVLDPEREQLPDPQARPACVITIARFRGGMASASWRTW